MILNFTSFGRQAVAIGGQERVARLSGVPITRVKVMLFVFSGFLAAIGGLRWPPGRGGDAECSDWLELTASRPSSLAARR